eukprot:3055954-Lingulodinium_polyedra.AAC.1
MGSQWLRWQSFLGEACLLPAGGIMVSSRQAHAQGRRFAEASGLEVPTRPLDFTDWSVTTVAALALPA